LNIIRKCVPITQKIYSITERLKTPEEVEKHFPGLISFVDCTEQQIPKPADKNRRKTFYPGKKKRHTVNQITGNNRGCINHKADHKKGRKHDYIYKNIRTTIRSSQRGCYCS